MLVDTHCHLDLPAFDSDRAAVIGRASEAGIRHILVPSLNLESAEAVVSLSDGHPMLCAAIGIHPTESKTWTHVSSPRLRELAKARRVVAFGEIGLDYYWDASPRATQRSVLREQLDLAAEFERPVVIHCREAKDAAEGPCTDDVLSILAEWVQALKNAGVVLMDRPGVLHSFSGSARVAARAVQLGFYIGVSGPVTYKRASARREVVASIPDDRLLLETDAPYLAPVPHRGRRNEPAFVSHIADRIAEVKGLRRSEIDAITSQNADRLFRWEHVS